MDLNRYLALKKADSLGNGRISDLVDDVQLNEMITGTQCSDLFLAAIFGAP